MSKMKKMMGENEGSPQLKHLTMAHSSPPWSVGVIIAQPWCLLDLNFFVFPVWHPMARVDCVGWPWCQTFFFFYFFIFFVSLPFFLVFFSFSLYLAFFLCDPCFFPLYIFVPLFFRKTTKK